MKLEVKWMNITTFLDCRIHERKIFISFDFLCGRAKSLKLAQFVDMKIVSWLSELGKEGLPGKFLERNFVKLRKSFLSDLKFYQFSYKFCIFAALLTTLFRNEAKFLLFINSEKFSNQLYRLLKPPIYTQTEYIFAKNGKSFECLS